MRILVTGASGFVGQALVKRLAGESETIVRVALRRAGFASAIECEQSVIGNIDANTDWRTALASVDVVVHLAARVHVMRDQSVDPLAEFRLVNVAGTINLAQQAAKAGVGRFVYLSSVKVNGEGGAIMNERISAGRYPYRETDVPAPEDAYGISKHEAEEGLRKIAAKTGIAVVIIRSPLIYGPGVQANFYLLMRAIAKGIPLPLGATHNRRSLVSLDNLIDFIMTCVEHEAAANQTFLVSDGQDISTTELIRGLARAMNRPARLIPVPPSVLMVGATLLGKRAMARRLLGSLQVDISKARQMLGWRPPFSMGAGMKRAVSPLATSR